PVPELSAAVRQALARMEELDRRRLELLASYLVTPECRHEFISRYFGRALDRHCGLCDNCLRAAQATVPDTRLRESRAGRWGAAGRVGVMADGSWLMVDGSGGVSHNH